MEMSKRVETIGWFFILFGFTIFILLFFLPFLFQSLPFGIGRLVFGTLIAVVGAGLVVFLPLMLYDVLYKPKRTPIRSKGRGTEKIGIDDPEAFREESVDKAIRSILPPHGKSF